MEALYQGYVGFIFEQWEEVETCCSSLLMLMEEPHEYQVSEFTEQLLLKPFELRRCEMKHSLNAHGYHFQTACFLSFIFMCLF